MNALEASLDPGMFIRHGEFMVLLRNGTRLQSSRTYYTQLKALTLNPF